MIYIDKNMSSRSLRGKQENNVIILVNFRKKLPSLMAMTFSFLVEYPNAGYMVYCNLSVNTDFRPCPSWTRKPTWPLAMVSNWFSQTKFHPYQC